MFAAVVISGSLEGAAQFLTVFFIFLIVFLFPMSYFPIGYNRNFEAIETYRLSTNKFLQIVRVGRRYFIVAIGKDEVKLISEISEEDIDLSAENPASNDRFKQIFETAKDKITKRGDKQ